ncbi:hypothetical protein FACS1894219_11560 [Clostridia bacterium]|nr:hypothetical protein FACS1894219_11560 [Clostridia bacterium]
MALSEEDKLKNFASDAISEARQISEEIEKKTASDMKKLVESGKKKIDAQTNLYIKKETEKIIHETSLEVSSADIRVHQEFLRKSDELVTRVLGEVEKKLADFVKSKAYTEYLIASCKNVLRRVSKGVVILYKPDEKAIIDAFVVPAIRDFIAQETKLSADTVTFQADSTITLCGLRFLETGRNILINDAIDEKLIRARDELTAMIAPALSKC